MKKLAYFVLTLPLFLYFNQAFASKEAPLHINGVVTINTHQAKQLYDLGVDFIDVRSQDEWARGHVKGAHNLGFNSVFAYLGKGDLIDKNVPIVIYCASSYCMQSAFASYLAQKWGFKKVFYFREGYYSWLVMDYPVEF